MRWLEGWFGTVSGAFGVVAMALIAVLVPVSAQGYSSTQSCSSINGVESCSTQYGSGASLSVQPDYGALILIALGLLMFACVLVGTWLDLSGRRVIGRLILLTGATLLIAAIFFINGEAFNGGSFAANVFLLPLALMGIVTGILACVRRAEPRAAPAVAPAPAAPRETDS